jgi:hypothetical protein
MNVKGLLCFVAVTGANAGLLYLVMFHASKELRPWLIMLCMLLLLASESKWFPKI